VGGFSSVRISHFGLEQSGLIFGLGQTSANDPKRTSKGLPRIDSGAPYNPKFHRHFSAISSSNQF
jgi:hypothetical protein